LPSCHLGLKAAKPRAYPTNPKTIGDHLKKRRHELGLFQKQAAGQMRVGEFTLLTWEKNQATPSVGMLPRIISFLGYDPHPEPATLGERIAAKRRLLGLSRKRTARQLSVDEATLALWESGHSTPTGVRLLNLTRFLDTTPDATMVDWSYPVMPR
jgi:transcriptional regulator with XRE-family HTH domain